MNFFSFCRRGALTGMLLLLGITSAQAADWPRQVTDSYGTHTLPSQPLRIVSTSVTLTGSLLAIDAPVVASGATTPNNRVADSQGFLRQWSEVAKARKLARLYIGEPSAEAVAAQMPDLILVSATGGDSALPLYDQLKTIAPTLVINYDDKSWQTLLTQLGQITGHEQQASARIADFNKQLVSLKEKMKLPPQPVTALVYTAAAHSANIWTPESAQGQMLEQLGFSLATLPGGLPASHSQGKRHDIVQLGGENLAAGLNGQSLFLPATRKMRMPSTPTRCWRISRRSQANASTRWAPRPSALTTTALCWCSSVSPACSANAGCAIRTGTRPAHLAGRRCACPAYNASVPQSRP